MKKYSIAILVIVILNFLIRIPFLNFPVHWDESVYFSGSLATLDNKLNPFIEFWSYKPPFIFELTALFYKFFGISRWMPRLIIALLSSLSVFLTYQLGKKIFNYKVGFWASILLFLNPLFFTQSNFFHAAIPLTALFLVTIYFYFHKKLGLYLLFASLLVLTKEPAILIIISLACFDFLVNFRKTTFGKLIRRELVILSPLLFFVAWVLLNKHFLGWYLWPYNTSYFSLSTRPYGRSPFSDFFSVAFQEHCSWFIFGLIFFVSFLSIQIVSLRKKIFNKWFFYFFSLAVIFPFIFYFGAFLPRYYLFTFPGLFLAFVWVLEKVFKREKMKILVLTVICFFFLAIPIRHLFFPKEVPEWSGERDMSYLKIIRVIKNTSDFVQKESEGNLIITRWPITSAFDNPFFGYVDFSPKRVVVYRDCQQLDDFNVDSLLVLPLLNIPIFDKTGDFDCIEMKGFRLIKEIEWVKIYQRTI